MLSSSIVFGQSVDDTFAKDNMQKDLDVFKQIRQQANSGLYKYRSKEQIDSSYHWAEQEINTATSYIDFYNIICALTDFEGSVHNETGLSDKHQENLRKESYGYFPYPIKWIDGKWLINYEDGTIPLGSEIIKINGQPITEVIDHLGKYYTTDGQNLTGKRIGLQGSFSKFYRFYYGLQSVFEVTYRRSNSNTIEQETLTSVGYSDYYLHVGKMHSMSLDRLYYAELPDGLKYYYSQVDSSTGLLTINDFSMGNESTDSHKKYASFLDSVFTNIDSEKMENLIVDVRINGGGDDPNDLVTYSYLTTREFQESKEVWISFQKVPLLKYYDSPWPAFIRPFGVGKFNRQFRKRFPTEREEKYYISKTENEMKVRAPNEKAFTGDIYLLISPAVASAGSLFASMVAGNHNTTVIGEETMGGYYGHNGHTSLDYILPKSKISISFFIDNIEQDVPIKENQIYGRGIIPDYEVRQTSEDFLNNADTQMNFVLKLIEQE